MPKDTNKPINQSIDKNETLVYNQAWREKVQYPSDEELKKFHNRQQSDNDPKYEFQEGYVN